jgi:hypothetical protein
MFLGTGTPEDPYRPNPDYPGFGGGAPPPPVAPVAPVIPPGVVPADASSHERQAAADRRAERQLAAIERMVALLEVGQATPEMLRQMVDAIRTQRPPEVEVNVTPRIAMSAPAGRSARQSILHQRLVSGAI